MTQPAALVADHEENLRGSIARALESQGFAVDVAANGSEALAKLRARPFDVALVAAEMPGPSAFEVLDTVARERIPTGVAITTSAPSVEGAVRALRARAVDYLVKPLDVATVVSRLATIVKAARAASNGARRIETDDLRVARGAFERAHVRRVLEKFGEDKVRAAEALGIDLSSLYRKLGKGEEP